MTKNRYLTKSRFKLACECPTKLYYTGKKEYANTMMDDAFLKALADGGYQVGELAKQYFPGGHDIKSLDYDQSCNETNTLLAQESVTIFEAAVRYESLFIRVDVLEKKGNTINLIEVKAKSFDSSNPDTFLTKRGDGLVKAWVPYLYDVAFQKHVISQAFPDCEVKAFLMLVDKNSHCPSDGLNQKFRIVKNQDGRWDAEVAGDLSEEDLSEKLLCKVPVDAYCDMIYDNKDNKEPYATSFNERVISYADYYERDEKLDMPISEVCGKCEFKADNGSDLKSGLKECWSKQLGWKDKDFQNPSILSLWNYRNKGKMIKQGKTRLIDLHEEDINIKESDKPGLSNSERQWLQVEKAKENNNDIWIDHEGLKQEMSNWVFPLHFIDFETAMPAIPFNKGRRPYEGIAFQFSHHLVHENGCVEHKGQYLNTTRGEFPSYDFVRALKKELSDDKGSVFMYSPHENTYLNMIYQQLKDEPSEIVDRDELCDFIQSITHGKDGEWTGERDMIDMLVLVKSFYFDPECEGSNSIKKILPSILNRSTWLQNKYVEPIYGAEDGVSSLNYKNWVWVEKKNGRVADPYTLLPKMFEDMSEHDSKILSADDELKDGGAAMTAYARLQNEEMSDYESKEIQKALLKYCELDTLAMVMLYEGWREMLSKS